MTGTLSLRPETLLSKALAALRLCSSLGVVLIGLAISSVAQVSWPLWEAYSQAMIDAQGRVIDRSAQDRTTSEGQAYALFFALVDNDRERFDLLLHWTEQNLAAGDLSQRLPAWSWGKNPDGSWGVTDQNPASDADLWMAYSLSEAGRLWRVPRFQALATDLAARIAQQEASYIPGLGTTLLPGPNGFHPSATVWVLNPSYMPPPLLAYFAKTMPQGPWAAVLQSFKPLLSESSGRGFAMDWAKAGQGIYPSQPPSQLDTFAPAIGSYDAIRVYLWLGISDPQTTGVRSLLPDVQGMADYMKSHLTPPEKVDSAGNVLSPLGPPGFSAALIPYLRAVGATAPAQAQMDRFAATKNPATGLYGKEAAYYDQNLALFATGWLEHRYRFDRDGRLLVHWR